MPTIYTGWRGSKSQTENTRESCPHYPKLDDGNPITVRGSSECDRLNGWIRKHIKRSLNKLVVGKNPRFFPLCRIFKISYVNTETRRRQNYRADGCCGASSYSRRKRRVSFL